MTAIVLNHRKQIFDRLFPHFFAVFIVHKKDDVGRLGLEFLSYLFTEVCAARIQNRNCAAILKLVISPVIFAVRGSGGISWNKVREDRCHELRQRSIG